MVPSDHAEQKAYLRLYNLPVNELANTVPIIKLEFDTLPAPTPPPSENAETAEILRR